MKCVNMDVCVGVRVFVFVYVCRGLCIMEYARVTARVCKYVCDCIFAVM